jgi:hypothetical protein
MTMPDTNMKRYTLLRRADGDRRETDGPAERPSVRRLTLVRRAQTWPPLPAGVPRAPRH